RAAHPALAGPARGPGAAHRRCAAQAAARRDGAPLHGAGDRHDEPGRIGLSARRSPALGGSRLRAGARWPAWRGHGARCARRRTAGTAGADHRPHRRGPAAARLPLPGRPGGGAGAGGGAARGAGMIVGTAGHIDHGKTALVRALTGIDGDRLPEERRRGITIEPGYASMPRDDGPPIGFVDVPGHERLVHAMVAGASGIDFALLLVAADDGVMPQTVEHLAILVLLGISRGAAVLTKADRVDAAVLAGREAQARALLSRHGRGDWPVLAVSALRGDGIDALRALLCEQARLPGGRGDPRAGFRMPLDRAFTVDGIGTVVAGSIAAGTVRVGDVLALAHDPGHGLRVRSLQAHGVAVESAGPGQRCAVGLVGLARERVERGHVLCAPPIAQSGERLDAWLALAPDEPRALRSGTRVHLHIGTRKASATVAILGAPALEPGAEGLAQLVLPAPVHAWQGDRFVIRDASAARTIGGGTVLAPNAPGRHRQAPERLAFLHAQ